MNTLINVFSIIIAVLLSGCQQQRLYKDTRVLMGTFVEVISPEKRASKIAFDEMQRLENLLSKYKPDSEVSRLNAKGELKLSPEAFFIIKRSKDISQASGGAFDITVAPLVDLWGFTDRKFKIPQDTEIKETLKLVGSEKIVLNDSNNVVKFSFPGMKIDLGGIAKGYALDCAAKKLKDAGIKSCLINAGGQVYALGDKFGTPWMIGIKDPRRVEPTEFITLENQSTSTSGNYQQFFIKDGVRYAHIIDPKTGFPAKAGLISVTVTAPEGLTADALSTAIFVLGKEKGEALAKNFPQIKLMEVEEKTAKTQ
ncbi:MAG: FAD:protein FMN transferase [Candidatus Omnitrophica bacterium]|nr:FAD:protein FMN transferase [Candidatus Omnitrophota bacterium]